MIYLKNNICNFKPYFKVDLNKKKNIFCTCFFKMNSQYKNFDIYIFGLKRWIKYLNSSNNNYILRIFIDKHIKNDENIMKLLNSCKKIELILFTCIDYIKDDYHREVFGALVRYFPLFNFPNNDTKNVIVVDIDINVEDRQRLINAIKDNTNNDIIVMGTMSNFLFNNEIPHLMSGLMFFNDKKYDYNILINFIKNAENIKDKGFYDKRLTPFGYGTDELFINKYFIKNINYIYITINYTPQWFIYHSKDIIFKSPKKTFKIFKYILGKYYNNQNIEEMFNFIDKNLYNIFKRTTINTYLAKRFYIIIKYLINKNKKWLSNNIMNIIIKYFNNILYSTAYFKIDMVNNKLVNIINKNVLYV
jgi:hypothetical protein